MNKLLVATAGLGLAVGGAAAAGTLDAPLQSLSEPVLSVSSADSAPLLPVATDAAETYQVASVSDSVGGGGGGGFLS